MGPNQEQNFLFNSHRYPCREFFAVSVSSISIVLHFWIALSIDVCAGTYGGARNPSQFLCLTLKLLQIQPEPEVVREYILQEDSKYLRLLGAFYLRLTGKADQVLHSGCPTPVTHPGLATQLQHVLHKQGAMCHTWTSANALLPWVSPKPEVLSEHFPQRPTCPFDAPW